MKQYINDLMRDRRNGILDKVAKVLLYIISLIYGLVVRIWDLLYSTKVLKAHKVSPKVISIGNITVGGTGKTPFTIFLAQELMNRGQRISILMRGYGNDEWQMVKRSLESIPVIVGRDRVKSANDAEKLYNAEILLLDDGFQHRRLKRDLNILLIDAVSPFGNKHMLPRGVLREPLSAIKCADIIVLTKVDLGRHNVDGLRKVLSECFKIDKIVETAYKPIFFSDIATKNQLELNVIKGRKIGVFSGIADPRYFKHILRGLGAVLVREFDYPDHQDYSKKDIDFIEKESEKSNCEFIITTEKDSVKLERLITKQGKAKILALYVKIEITSGMEELIDRVSGPNSSKCR